MALPKKSKAVKTEMGDKPIGLDQGADASEVAEAVFKKLIPGTKEEIKKEVKGEVDGRFITLIYGGIIVTILFVATLVWDVINFKAGYDQANLDTRKDFSEQINSLVRENAQKELERQRELDRLMERQNELEQLLIQKKK